MNNTKYLALMAFAAVCLQTYAAADDNQSYTRENPTIETGPNQSGSRINYPSYINLDANHIDMNGADWTSLKQVMSVADSCPVTIVHIGDSHLQADMGTAVTRDYMGHRFGGLRGRGLIIPFKLAGTNQPVDYTITSTTSMTQSRLLKTPWPTAMGFTGIGIQPPADSQFDLEVSTREPYDALTIYYSGDSIEVVNVMSDGLVIPFVAERDDDRSLEINLPGQYTTCDITFKSPDKVAIHGVNASYGNTGLAYEVIGNNGATFATYSGIGNVGNDIANYFMPDLIILSLGTNEAFSTISDAAFRKTIDDFVKEIKATNPDASILLTTPQECQRKGITRGRKRRRRRTSFTVNANVKRMRDVIVAYGHDNNIPVYDWYAVAGGTGSSAMWVTSHTINTDRIHLTLTGYRIQGSLMAEALIEALTDNNDSNRNND